MNYIRRMQALALTVAFLLFPVPASANGISLYMETYANTDDENVTVSVCISQNSGAEMIQFALGYDSEKLELTELDAGDALLYSTAPTFSNPNMGSVYFVWDSLKPLMSGGALLIMRFQPIKGMSGEASVWIDYDDDFIFADENYNPLDIVAENGVIILSDSDNSIDDAQPKSDVEQNILTEGYNDGVTLSSNVLDMATGSTGELKTDCADDGLVWFSTNAKIVSIEDGCLKAKSKGTAIITVTTEDGKKEATCVINVQDMTGEEAIEVIPCKSNIDSSVWLYLIAAIGVGVVFSTIWVIRKRKALRSAPGNQNEFGSGENDRDK